MKNVSRQLDINPITRTKATTTTAAVAIKNSTTRTGWDSIRGGTWDLLVWPVDISIRWPLIRAIS